jgi:hypothetical protein
MQVVTAPLRGTPSGLFVFRGKSLILCYDLWPERIA